MNVKSILRSATFALTAFAATAIVASANDRVVVEFPFDVTVGKTVLESGKYTIDRLSNSNSRVLVIRNEDGQFQTMMMPIPTYSLRTPEDTKVVLHKIGDHEYHFNKIWVQGKNYGYEIPLPENVKSRQAEWLLAKSITQPASYENVNVDEATPVEIAESQWSGSADGEGAAPAEAEAAPQSEPEMVAYAAPAAESADSDSTVADVPEMPETAANWLPAVLLGGGLSAAGLRLFRRR